MAHRLRPSPLQFPSFPRVLIYLGNWWDLYRIEFSLVTLLHALDQFFLQR